MPLNSTTKPDDEKVFEKIIDEIFSISVPKISEDRRNPIQEFIKSTVNGDKIINHLVIPATLKKDDKGILVYILTNNRLIKIEIDEKGIQSSGLLMNTMIGVERKLLEGDRAEVEVVFQNGSIGLRYASNNQKITEFFQNVDNRKGDSNG